MGSITATIIIVIGAAGYVIAAFAARRAALYFREVTAMRGRVTELLRELGQLKTRLDDAGIDPDEVRAHVAAPQHSRKVNGYKRTDIV